MPEMLSDVERVLRLSERMRLLVAVSEEIPVESKLNAEAMLKMFEAAVAAADDPADRARASGYYRVLYRDLEPYADLEALLSAMRVFAPYL
ncbi:MAG: hypothetical protein HY699_02275 [Deltaproteobacteria bacterium]|nr:hypothetical protein [Deltaproteobacteria bacterium]